MITKRELQESQQRAAYMIADSGLIVTDEEVQKIEVVDFGLSHLEIEGAQILTLVQTKKYGVKLLALFPNQTLPEHWHPPVGNDPGKEETVRVHWGTLYFYVDGKNNLSKGFIPKKKEDVYTCRHEFIMKPGDQLTLSPGMKHWFQAGHKGAVLFSFSSLAHDALDGFTDTNIRRITEIKP